MVPSLQVMQKLGKADETRDAAFEEMVANFNKQMVGDGFHLSFFIFHLFTLLFAVSGRRHQTSERLKGLHGSSEK